MTKIILQAVITVFIFFATWFGLSQINWVEIFNIKKVTDSTEQKLGNMFWELIKKSEKENNEIFIKNSIDSIITKICKSNDINKENIKVHIINKDMVNAFALPDGHLVVFSGLILNSENQEELTGVICHEIAHIRLNHVMKKLVKEIGLSTLLSITTGNGGTEIIKETAKILSSSAFDRNMEKEADIKAIDYMINAKVNPEFLANFLYKQSQNEMEATKYLSWINTHPDSKERAEYIIDYSKGKSTDYKLIISLNTWNKLKQELQNDVE